MNRKLRISRFAGEFGRIVKILSRYLKYVPVGDLGREGMVKPSPGRVRRAAHSLRAGGRRDAGLRAQAVPSSGRTGGDIEAPTLHS
jgi:hypothetical protein